MQLYADGIDITESTGALSWKNSTDEVATTMSFSIAKDLSSRWTATYLPTHGSIISYFTASGEMFRGIVLSVDDGDVMLNNYTVADYGFFLKKSKETYQFNSISANSAIEQMCSDFGTPIDSICDIGYTVKKIYMDKTIYDIMKDILELAKEATGADYNIDVTPKGLRIYKIGDIVASPAFKLADNLSPVNSVNYYGPKTHKTSNEDMYNAVKVITGNDDGFTQRAFASDEQSIATLGRRQEVIKIEDDKVGNASQVAQNKLAELNVIKEEFSFPIIEDVESYTRAGSVIIEDGITYLIKESEHAIDRGTHTVTLNLQRRG